jgi:cell division protein FtsB
MTTTDQERAAYVAGDIDRASLLARIDDLTEALGRAVAEIETLRDERDALAAEVANND